MLPPLDRLRLRDATGGFVVLDQAAVNDLNASGVIDPISMERPIHQGTFRVQMRTPKPNGDPRYSYWNPEDLWKWVSRPESEGSMPDNREKIWYEDWWALYYTYGPTPTVPAWARALDKRQAATQPAQGGNAGGGGGGGGGFGNQNGGGLFVNSETWPNVDGSGGWVNHWMGAQNDRLEERNRLENEAMRVAQLPYRSLAPLPEMTGINGHFYLVGGASDNPTPFEIVQALRYRVSDEPELYADKLHIRMIEQNLDPFHNPPHGIRVTLVMYEFNGLTDQEGEDFRQYYRDMAGESGVDSGAFYQEFFDLPTVPMEGENGAPKWGEDPSGIPPTLHITPGEYDAWVREAQEERIVLQEAEREAAQLREQRTRSRAAAGEHVSDASGFF